MGLTGAAKFTPRGTTYVFVNVVVAPRYVARVQLGSGGLKISLTTRPPASSESSVLFIFPPAAAPPALVAGALWTCWTRLDSSPHFSVYARWNTAQKIHPETKCHK